MTVCTMLTPPLNITVTLCWQQLLMELDKKTSITVPMIPMNKLQSIHSWHYKVLHVGLHTLQQVFNMKITLELSTKSFRHLTFLLSRTANRIQIIKPLTIMKENKVDYSNPVNYIVTRWNQQSFKALWKKSSQNFKDQHWRKNNKNISMASFYVTVSRLYRIQIRGRC